MLNENIKEGILDNALSIFLFKTMNVMYFE